MPRHASVPSARPSGPGGLKKPDMQLPPAPLAAASRRMGTLARPCDLEGRARMPILRSALAAHNVHRKLQRRGLAALLDGQHALSCDVTDDAVLVQANGDGQGLLHV